MKLDTKAMIFEKAKAGYPALYLNSSEDQRSLREIKEAADELGRGLYVWTLGKGLIKEGGKSNNKAPAVVADSELPPGALTAMSTLPEKSIFVLRLFHHFLEAPQIQSLLIDLIPEFKLKAKMLIILTPVQKLPPELEKEFALVETALPDKTMLERVLTGIVVGSRLPDDKKPSEETKKLLIDAAAGLTTPEADNAFALALLRPSIQKTGKIWDPQVVLEEKMAALKKTGLLEYIPAGSVNMKSVGGMKALKRWVSLRKRAFTDEAKTFGLPAPKGILMVGPPGSGKSLGAKAVSNELNLPLIRCDFGKLLGSLVGQSESNMRKAIDVAEAASPCVLWIDEIEKALAGSSGGSHDSGVGARLLGYLLTWMQEKTSPVFVYATANDVTGLPPELLRKGRFDEMWSVLLPNEEERMEIFSIHLAKRGRDKLIGERSKNKHAIDLAHFARDTAGFSGAEIEAAIIESLFLAFDEKRDLTFLDLQNAVDSTMPLSKTMAAKIKALEDWCRDKTRAANGDENYSVDAILAAGGSRKVEA
jgi:SpoVK/Ycf46/Vps4 family AAA+-type ATPase